MPPQPVKFRDRRWLHGLLLALTALTTTLVGLGHYAAFLSELGARTVGVVSSDGHLPRALALFRRMGVVAEAVPAPSPDPGGLRRALRAAREFVASLIDRVVMLTW